MSALDSPRFHPVPRSSPMVNKRKDMEQSHIQLLLQRSTGYSVMYAGYDTSPNQTWRRRDFVWVFPSGVLILKCTRYVFVFASKPKHIFHVNRLEIRSTILQYCTVVRLVVL